MSYINDHIFNMNPGKIPNTQLMFELSHSFMIENIFRSVLPGLKKHVPTSLIKNILKGEIIIETSLHLHYMAFLITTHSFPWNPDYLGQKRDGITLTCASTWVLLYSMCAMRWADAILFRNYTPAHSFKSQWPMNWQNLLIHICT